MRKLKIAPDTLKKMLNTSRCTCRHLRAYHADSVTSRQHNDGKCSWPHCTCPSFKDDRFQ